MVAKMAIKTDKEKRRRWGFLIFIIIPILIYLPYYLRGEVPGNVDLIQNFSDKSQFTEQLLKGGFPQWDQYLAGGMPRTSARYIADVVLSLLPLKQYIYLFFIVHLFIGSFFFYLYLRENRCSYMVSMVMGVIYECSTQINGLRKGHPSVIASICLFPVIMYLVKKFFNTGQKRWFYLSAVAAAMQASAMQQYSVYADLVLFIYILVLCIHGRFRALDIIKKGINWLAVYVGVFAYALLPILDLMSEYKKYGSAAVSYETFTGWSIHPVKIIQMIIPKFFGDIYQGMGNYYSSEMDIEIYLGIFVLLLAVSVVIKCRERMDIRLDLLCAVFAFLYAAVAHIPVLSRIVYHLPVLGSFRCAGRMMYIFYFFMLSLAGRGLENLTGSTSGTSGEGQGMLMKKLAKGLLAGVVCLAIAGAFAVSLLVSEGQIQYYYKLKDTLLAPLIYLAVILAVLWLLRQKKIYKWEFAPKWKPCFICVTVLVITLAEVLPYSLITSSVDFSQFYGTDEAMINIKKDIGNYKIWDAFNGVDGAHNSIISQNKNQIEKVSAVNAYTVYNNPLVAKYFKNLGTSDAPFNYSGLFTGSLNAYNNVLLQNDLLSMMGVKYVIDSSGIIESTGGMIYGSQCESEPVFEAENIKLPGDANGINVSELMSGVQADTCYKITFSVKKEDNAQLSFLAADLYGGENYDLAPQEKQFFISENGEEYTAYLISAHAEQATEDIRFRILASFASGEVTVERCQISVVRPQNGYIYWGSDEAGTKIYENVNAEDIVYFPDRVVRKESFEDIYDNCETYDLARTAYVDRESGEYQGVKTTVGEVSYENDSLTAKVTADADAYLCFSQNYSQHWSVEVDGSEQEVDMVNGLIMGTHIPKGEHTVVFKYHSSSYAIGYAVTGGTIAALLACWFFSRRRRKKPARE